MKFYSPLTAEFFPDEPDWEDESYNEYEGYPMDGHDLLQYADAVDEAVKKDIARVKTVIRENELHAENA